MLDDRDKELIKQMIQKSIRNELKQFQMLDGKDNEHSMDTRMKTYQDVLKDSTKKQRKAKVLFTNAGGSASKGSLTTRITLPITWVREMGITPDNREVDIYFQDGKIIIEKTKVNS